MNEMLSLSTSIRWQDIADIALNSYLLFRLYALFRGTKVFRMLVGVALLWFFQEVTVSLGFIVSSLAIQGIIAVSAFIIIVVFSNEIRSVFRAKNLKAVFWGFPKESNQTPVEIIVESVFEMAQKYCGALIAFPGKKDLQEIVQGGIPWDGLVSKEMIKSIFWYGNPVHDGAIIIQGDRVTEVGVILPLSKRNLPSSYGTRHRAAKGLTEQTDALVVIVSEERGAVLAAKGTRLSVMYSKKDLECELLKHSGRRIKQQGHVKKENFGIGLGTAAVISVLFVTGVWFGITRGLNTLITLEVPVEYINLAPSMEISATSENKVQLHLSGSQLLIKSVRPEDIRVRVDTSEVVVGYNAFTITTENISLPPGILLTKVSPKVLELDIDTLITMAVPVQTDWVGKLDENLILTHAKISPQRIRLMGNTRILGNLPTLYTEKVSLDKLSQSGKITANLAIDPTNLRVAPGSKDQVTIEYQIRKRAEDEFLPD
ncbi:MAG: hypothetical protein B6245_20930 [Desulfobacteraceae bacterium 4572_88]|nr:MAG: hypothetical protein B6245_20930 [Desulfobacteraceae bacterium 4572_88]